MPPFHPWNIVSTNLLQSKRGNLDNLGFFFGGKLKMCPWKPCLLCCFTGGGSVSPALYLPWGGFPVGRNGGAGPGRPPSSFSGRDTKQTHSAHLFAELNKNWLGSDESNVPLSVSRNPSGGLKMKRCCWRWQKRWIMTWSPTQLSWNRSWIRRSTSSSSSEVGHRRGAARPRCSLTATFSLSVLPSTDKVKLFRSALQEEEQASKQINPKKPRGL